MNVEFVHVQKVFMDENVNVILHHQLLNRKFNNVKSMKGKNLVLCLQIDFILDQDHRIFVQEEDNVIVEDVNVKQQQLKYDIKKIFIIKI
jgi:NAD/NADP transhydrogenase alpha subunit